MVHLQSTKPHLSAKIDIILDEKFNRLSEVRGLIILPTKPRNWTLVL